MARRYRTTRVTQQELDQTALRLAPQQQKDVVIKLMDTGFQIYKILRRDDDVMIIAVTHPKVFGIVYPDGTFQRAPKGSKTVDIDWNRARNVK